MEYKYDLHIHTALSPCADDDMTPAPIAGLSKLSGLDLIAITDHNHALNLPAAKEACDYYGLKMLPGIEANTAEEIHVLCYFPTVENALKMGEILYAHLPDVPADPDIWGNQLILNADDNVTGKVKKLLSAATSLTIYEIVQRCRDLGGIPVPAHCDREAFSIFSVLGMFPEDIDFDYAEMRHPGNYRGYIADGRMPAGLEILFSSDAHHIAALERDQWWTIKDTSALAALVSSQ